MTGCLFFNPSTTNCWAIVDFPQPGGPIRTIEAFFGYPPSICLSRPIIPVFTRSIRSLEFYQELVHFISKAAAQDFCNHSLPLQPCFHCPVNYPGLEKADRSSNALHA